MRYLPSAIEPSPSLPPSRASRERSWRSILVCFALVLMLMSIGSQSVVLADEESALFDLDDPESIAWLSLTPPSAPLPTKPWNILLYAAADIGEQAFKPAEAFAQFVASSESTNVLILEDRYSGTEDDIICTVRRSSGTTQIIPLLDLGEAETDEPETLERFLRFAQEWFPAVRTLLFMYGHGGGWRGACNDESNGQTRNLMDSQSNWLTPPEMKAALESVGGVDALMFSAPCVMSSLEAAYELRHVTDLYVASEEVSGYIFWWTAVGRIAARLADDPTLGIDELGEHTINAIRENIQQELDTDRWPGVISDLPNIAAFATPALGDVATAVDSLAASILALPLQEQRELITKRCSIPQYISGELVDMPAFAQLCREFPTLSDAADRVVSTYQVALVGQVASGSNAHGDAGGMSIFLPNPLSISCRRFASIYSTIGLSFLERTQWWDVIELFKEVEPAFP
ncbi:clostripain-related cysteine peptidase [Candidatus Bipolaricaulota bacterium]